MSKAQQFYLVSLGCPKNLVDSEGVATLLRRAGYEPAGDPAEADLVIVNTCGFIESAREESIQVLRKFAEERRPGQRIIAAGCYSQRSPTQLVDLVPGIDGVIGTRSWYDIVNAIRKMDRVAGSSAAHGPYLHSPSAASSSCPDPNIHRVAVQGTSAYLKIADGCSRSCAYCAIPIIKGPTVSRSPDSILEDARWLADIGIQEIILIAQDTTSYGRDLGMKHGLAHLIEKIVSAAPEVPWIRIMYAYPSLVTRRLVGVMADHPQVLDYLDIPLQHAHPEVLRRMQRPSNMGRVKRSLQLVRESIPDVTVRTTFLVGFPGESEDEFLSLLDFVAEMQFDRVGVFTYSHEHGTPAAAYQDDVPAEVKEDRKRRILEAQQPISWAKNSSFVGRTVDALIEGTGDGLSIGRSYRDAPEIDGLVVTRGELPVGQIAPVRITEALEYDLVGVPT
jgi:ribosomal protein S12 methylthiotransferase